MANDFVLKIGMTTQQVMQNIGNMNATDKTKQLIINFCNNDYDKKITNEIELAMLDSWSKGSEKIKMPTAEGMKEYKWPHLDEENKNTKYYRAGNRELSFRTDENGLSCAAYNWRVNNPNEKIYTDVLNDSNSDGYADDRILNEHNRINENHDILTSYSDYDLDGVFDAKFVDETINGNNSDTYRETIVDLSTNNVTRNIETKNQSIKNKNGTYTFIEVVTNFLTGKIIKNTGHWNPQTGESTDTTTVEQLKKTP